MKTIQMSRRLRLCRFAAAILLLVAAADARADSRMDEQLKVAEFHLKAGRYKEAGEILDKLAREPGAPAAVFRGLGEVQLQRGERDAAAKSFEQSLKREPDERTLLQLVSMLSQRNDQWKKATDLLEPFVSDHPDALEPRQHLAELLVFQGRIDEALPHLRKLVDAKSDDAEARLLYARGLVWTGRAKEARGEFQRATKDGAPLRGDDLKWIAQAEEAGGDVPAANARFRDFLAGHPDDADALAGLARTAFVLKKTAEGQKALDRLLELEKDKPELAVEIARIHVRRGAREAALPFYEKALDRDPKPAVAREYADILASVGKSKDAVAVVERYGQDEGAEPSARLRLLAQSPETRVKAMAEATGLIHGGASPEVWRISRDLMISSPAASVPDSFAEQVAAHFRTDPAVREKLAAVYAAHGRQQQAQVILQDMHKRAADDPGSLASVAGMQMKQGKPDEAKKLLAANASLVEKQADLLAIRAGLAFGEGKLDDAEADYKAALALNPRQPQALAGLARIDLARKDYAAAGARLGLLAKVDPGEAGALRSEIELQQILERLDSSPSTTSTRDAERLLRKALARDPKRVDARLRLAQLLERADRGREALGLYQGLQQLTPPINEAYLGPVRIHLRAGDQKAADDAYARYQEKFPGQQDRVQISLKAATAEALKQQGNHAAAITAYAEAIKLSPENPDLLNGIAGVYFAAGRFDDALSAFREAAAADPKNSDAVLGQVDVLSRLASQAAERGDNEAARGYVEQALKASGGSQRALERTIDLAMSVEEWGLASDGISRLPEGAARNRLREIVEVEQGLAPWRKLPLGVAPAEVLALAERGLKVAPGRVDLMLARAQALERLGDAPRALASFRELAARPDPPDEAFGGQVRTLCMLGRFAEAEAALAELRKRFPKSADGAERAFFLAKASALKKAGRGAEATELAERARSRWPENFDVLVTLGGIDLEFGRAEQAVADFQAALRQRPGNVIARQGLAGAYFKSGRLEEAAKIYDEILAEAPGDVGARRARADVWLTLAGRQLEAGDRDGARASLDQALVLDDRSQPALEMKLQLAFDARDWKTARMLAGQMPDAARGRKLAELVSVMERLAPWREKPQTLPPKSALELARRGIALAPDRVDLRLDEARALELAGDTAGALKVYRALASGPNPSSEGFAGEIGILIALGRYQDAEEVVNEFARLHPDAGNGVRARLRRAQALGYARAGRLSDAIEMAREALAYGPEDPDTLDVLGGIYAQAGDFKSAVAAYRAALQGRPNDPLAFEGLAGAYEGLGDYDSAEDAYRRLAAIPGHLVPGAVWTRITFRRALTEAQRLTDAGRFQEAKAVLERVRLSYPREPDVWAALSEVSLRLRLKTLALAYAEQGLTLQPESARLVEDRIRALADLERWNDAAEVLSTNGSALGDRASVLAHDIEHQRERSEREKLIRAGKLDEAYLLLAKQYQNDPKDPEILKAIGFLFLRTKQFPEARRFFQEAALVTPDDADVQAGEAYALRGSGDSRQAVKILERIYAEHPDANLAVALAEIYHELGRDEDAQRMLGQARRLAGETRTVQPLPSLAIGPASAGFEAPGEELLLPPLKLPTGMVRAVPNYEAPPPPEPPPAPPAPPPAPRKRSRKVSMLAGPMVAENVVGDTLNDAAPPEAALFAGAALEALARGGNAAPEITQALPGFDQLMDDVRGRRRLPPPEPTPEPELIRPQPELAPEAPSAPLPPPMPAPPPQRGPVFHPPPPAPTPDLRLQYERERRRQEAEGEARGPETPLSPEARSRASRLSEVLVRERRVKFGAGYRFDFLDSVSDVNADQFSINRFPIYVDLPAIGRSRLRLTVEPTIVDNGIISDQGVAGEASWRDLPLIAEALYVTVALGLTPAGFPHDPDITGYGRLYLKPRPYLSIGPIVERSPVTESLLSFRGNTVSAAGGRRTFFGKVMQNRFGGNLSFSPPESFDGTIEAAYSRLTGVNVDDNEKFDAYFGLGRRFPLGRDFYLRPGGQIVFFHYEKDLSAPHPPSGGYFSPDAFTEFTVRLDASGPIAPEVLPGARFTIGGRAGGQTISGVEARRFRDAEGSRGVYGFEGSAEFPIEDIAIVTLGGGYLDAKPYKRGLFFLNVEFPF